MAQSTHVVGILIGLSLSSYALAEPVKAVRPINEAVQMNGTRAPVILDRAPKAVLLSRPETDLSGWKGSDAAILPPIDTAALLAEDLRNQNQGAPLRVGIVRQMGTGPVNPARDGIWVGTGLPAKGVVGEKRVWRAALTSMGARSVGVNFSKFDLPPGARVVISSSDPTVPSQAFEGRGPLNEGTVYAPPLPGETVFVEYQPGPGGKAPNALEIDGLVHVYKGLQPAGKGEQPAEDLLSCEVDVRCRTVDLNVRDAVGQMLFQEGANFFVCTGTLLVAADPHVTPAYFLTANHCINSQAVASTLTVTWFYQTSACNAPDPGEAGLPNTTGATLLSTSAATGGWDSTLLRLADDVHAGQGLAGWNAGTIPAGDVVCISHPAGSFKRYAKGFLTAQAPMCFPVSNFIYNDWYSGEGIVEGGSSGSALLDSNWHVVGQLYGTCMFNGVTPGCDNPDQYNNMYGAFSGSYSIHSPYLNSVEPDDAYESNNSLAGAKPILLGSHALTLVDFDDYFRVNFPVAVTATISVTFGFTTGATSGVELYDSNNNQLANVPAFGGTVNFSQAVSAGAYKIHVYRIQGKGGNYTMDIEPNCLPAWTNGAAGLAARVDGAGAYDSGRGRVVVFGGFDSLAAANNETREWNGSAWSSVSGGSTPSARGRAGAAFDSARGQTVIFGGNSGGGVLGDTYEWNGTAWAFKSNSGPAARQYAALAYDSNRQRTVLFGGNNGVNNAANSFSDTWEWNGTSWTNIAVSGPSARFGHRMAFDPVRQVVVLFGGYDGSNYLSDVWEYDGTAWTQRTFASGPSGRWLHGLAYDSGRASTVVFGGNAGGAAGLNDTWEWDGSTWTQDSNPGPGGRYAFAHAYDSGNGRTVIFGGEDSGNLTLNDTKLLSTHPSVSFSSQPPATTRSCVGGSENLSVVVNGGATSYQWRRGGMPLADGPTGSGSTVAGSATATLSLSTLGTSDNGSYDCVVTTLCGNTSSTASVLTICVSDFNCSGTTTVQDVFAFLTKWFLHDASADVNHDNSTTVQDIFDFLGFFFSGC